MYRFGPAAVRDAARILGVDLSDQWEPQIRRWLVGFGYTPATTIERAQAWAMRDGFAWVPGMRATTKYERSVLAGATGLVLSVRGDEFDLSFDDDTNGHIATKAADWLPDLTHAPTAAICERTYLIAWAFRVHDEGTPRTIHVADVLVWLGVSEAL